MGMVPKREKLIFLPGGGIIARTMRSALPLFSLVVFFGSPPAWAEDSELWTDSIAPSVRDGMLLNFEGRYDAADEIWADLQERYPTHPAGALFAVETLYWRQIYDVFDRRLDGPIERKGSEALQLAADWLAAHPDSARAELFVGQAEIQLGRLDGMLKHYYAAGRHAERGRGHLDRALELDPGLIDAQYWLGMYFYYASTIQEVLQWLSWLWFIPEPDGPRGLQAIQLVNETGDIQQFSARLLLMNIFAYYEDDHAQATQFARALNRRFPENTLIHFELLRLLHSQERYDDAIEEARLLESHPAPDRLDRGRVVMARVWRARATRDSGYPNEAAAILAEIDLGDEAIPPWGRAWIHLIQGQIHLINDRPEQALAEFERAVEVADKSRTASRRAQEEIEKLRRRSQV